MKSMLPLSIPNDDTSAINKSMKPVSKINFTDDSVPMMELDDPSVEDYNVWTT